MNCIFEYLIVLINVCKDEINVIVRFSSVVFFYNVFEKLY